MATMLDQLLPITQTLRPAQWDELLEMVAQAYAEQMPLYPFGGATSLDYGLVPRREGWAVELTGLDRLIDYPSRDMTITVETGMRIGQLQQLLAAESQELPVDVPQADQATVGGVLATNFNGPRRFGHGTLRDYLLGVDAVDGRGVAFRGGGRVVKNVAGYDFCKLLIGSLGTLGILGQVTLKVKPRPETFVLAVGTPDDQGHLGRLLDALVVQSAVRPAAIEVLDGTAWTDRTPWSDLTPPPKAGRLVVRLEGTEPEVDWMTARLHNEWSALGVHGVTLWKGDAAGTAWNQLCQFPADAPSPLVLKITGLPHRLTDLVSACRALATPHAVLAHAGNGVVLLRFDEFPADGLLATVTQRLRPLAASAMGQVTILATRETHEATRQAVWGGGDAAYGLMCRVKQQFDPRNILNPQRFIFS